MQSAALRPRHALQTVPTELILEIISYLAPDAFLACAFANYHLLMRHCLTRCISSSTMTRLVCAAVVPSRQATNGLLIPPEVSLQILQHLAPVDAMQYALANYQVLAQQGIAPRLTVEILQRLRRAVGGRP
jgi:hypothetical protein